MQYPRIFCRLAGSIQLVQPTLTRLLANTVFSMAVLWLSGELFAVILFNRAVMIPYLWNSSKVNLKFCTFKEVKWKKIQF